jgi:hypothetical protein
MYYYIKMNDDPKGPIAARWRKRKFDQISRFHIPDDLLPGSFVRTVVKCGKPTCHCATGEGHPHWTLTFMSDGKRRVIHIPAAIVDDVRRRVEAGRIFQDAVRDVLTANAELLALSNQQTRARTAARKKSR